MEKVDSAICAPQLIEIPSISDDRGLLVPLTDYIEPELLRRSYIVEDYGRGIIRGFHYHFEEIKIFHIVSGAAKFLTIRIQPDVVKEGRAEQFIREHLALCQEWVLSSRHHGILVVPATFANGWISLETGTKLVSLSNLEFELAKDDDVRIEPTVINSKWKVTPR